MALLFAADLQSEKCVLFVNMPSQVFAKVAK